MRMRYEWDEAKNRTNRSFDKRAAFEGNQLSASRRLAFAPAHHTRGAVSPSAAVQGTAVAGDHLLDRADPLGRESVAV